MNKRRGFTLIELLMVLLIISILSTITFSTLQHQRMKARDAKRRADFDALRKSLELYYTSNNRYPAQDGTFVCIEDSDPFKEVMDDFISYIPEDPRYDQTYPSGTTSCYYYITINNGQDFKAKTILESEMEWYEIYSVGGRNID
jgi:prepilin-type N-terminal cleavage/methylation domain-containing protein